MARSERISVMVDDSVKKDFEKFAEKMGLTASSLGAYVIGSWTMQQRIILPSLLKSGKKAFDDAIAEDRKQQPTSDSGS